MQMGSVQDMFVFRKANIDNANVFSTGHVCVMKANIDNANGFCTGHVCV